MRVKSKQKILNNFFFESLRKRQVIKIDQSINIDDFFVEDSIVFEKAIGVLAAVSGKSLEKRD